MLSQTRVHASLPANDLVRARAFYERKLGLSPWHETPWAVVYELEGGSRFSVFPLRTRLERDTHRWGSRSPDVRAAVAELKERGVVFEEYDAPELKTIAGIADMDGRSAAWFKDTEGNLIEILERESPSLRAAIINPDKLARLGYPLSPLATRAPDRG